MMSSRLRSRYGGDGGSDVEWEDDRVAVGKQTLVQKRYAGVQRRAVIPGEAEVPRAAAAVQLKVYIKNNALKRAVGASHHEKKKTGRGTDSAALIADTRQSYYFDSKDEMEAYAAGTCTKAGFVGHRWVHLPDKMTVL